MWVKICANTNLADAQLAAELGADAVGFVFAPSKRQVTVEQAAAITASLPSSVERIGVFATGDAAEIADAAERAGLTGVQLHGRFDAGLLDDLSDRLPENVRMIQTVAYEAEVEDRAAADALFLGRLERALMHPAASAVLLDTARTGVSGGLGIAFDWGHAAASVRRARETSRADGRELPRLVLAGGLRAENVRTAVAALSPDGVDVASGVEARPGVKDPERLRAFLVAARG